MEKLLKSRNTLKYVAQIVLGLGVFVLALYLFLNNFVGPGARAATNSKQFNLLAGESWDLNCLGSSLSYDRKTSKTGRANCKANPTPTRVPTKVPVATVFPTFPPPTAVPTVAVTLTPVPTQTSSNPAGLSYAMGIWDPADAKYVGTGPQKYPVCPKALHDSYSVIGPDGLRYPTWHPPVVINPATGQKCTFGHEHGRDPSKYALFDTVRRHFAYDANKDGTIDAAELATAGIPFNYVNQQIDASSMGYMRHEDHVGNKIEYANGEGDTGDSDAFNTSLTGGIIIPEKDPSGPNGKWKNSGVSCYFFDKFHQGVSSPDAFTNNVHELIFHAKCTSTRAGYASNEMIISGLVAFGAPGEFTKFCNNDRDTIIKVGTDANNIHFPGRTGDGMRNIMTRDCVETTILVSGANNFSSFPYEDWSGGLSVMNPSGKSLVDIGGGWEVLDSIRYYYPTATNKIGYNTDTCYETFNGRQTHGGECDEMTQYGSIKGITWTDTRSGFKGLSRGQYVQVPVVSNAGGSGVYYTDAYGKNATTTYAPGKIKQVLSAVNSTVQWSTDPRIIKHNHDSGEGTVHAPN